MTHCIKNGLWVWLEDYNVGMPADLYELGAKQEVSNPRNRADIGVGNYKMYVLRFPYNFEDGFHGEDNQPRPITHRLKFEEVNSMGPELCFVSPDNQTIVIPSFCLRAVFNE